MMVLIMGAQPISDFNTQHGLFCILSNTARLFEYAGYHFSENMLCGLSGYTGFFYTRNPVPCGELLTGRTGNHQQLLKSLCDNLKVKWVGKKEKQFNECWQQLEQKMANKEPALVTIDDYHIDYHPYFRKHHYVRVVVLLGADEEQVYLYDMEPRTCRLDHFKRALSSQFTQDSGTRYCFKFPPAIGDMTENIKAGLGWTVAQMLRKPPQNHTFYGVRGIRAFAEDTDTIHREKRARNSALENIFRQLQRPGGPKISRLMFAGFLSEAKNYQKIAQVGPFGNAFLRLSDQWEIIGNLFFKSAVGKVTALSSARDRLLTIADKEEKLFQRLERCI